MVRITKVYTRTGDKGMTHLAGQVRVPKTSVRIAAIGCLDELNAVMGVAVDSMLDIKPLKNLGEKCIRIQHELFDLGAQLAVLPQDIRIDTPKIDLQDIKRLEQEIDKMNLKLSFLTSFILPGGGKTSAYLHVVRTVCRRAERALLEVDASEKLDGVEVPYLNRLSDWLFVAARFAALKMNKKELIWQPGFR